VCRAQILEAEYVPSGGISWTSPYWLDVFCPGCNTSRAIDLRTVDRHPLASVGTLVLGLRCSWCPGSAPMPKLLGLYALPPARGAGIAG
jgi:hypothetical protein